MLAKCIHSMYYIVYRKMTKHVKVSDLGAQTKET